MLRVLDTKEVAFVSGGMMEDGEMLADDAGGGGDGGLYADYYSGGDWDTTSNPTYTDPSTGDIVVTAPTHIGGSNMADTMDNISSGLGWAADGVGIYGGYLSLTAAAQGGLDVPNDAAAGAAWAGFAALKTTQFVTHGFAQGMRYLQQP